MKIKSAIYGSLFAGLLLVLIFGCKKSIVKDEVVKDLPTFKASTLTATTATSSTIITEIDSDGNDSITVRGVCWGTVQNPTVDNTKSTDGKGIGSFTSIITGLTPSATYYFRAYATNSVGTAYGTQISTTTLAATPVLTMTAMTNITLTSAKCSVNITDDRGSTITARGICWSKSSNPSVVPDSKSAADAGRRWSMSQPRRARETSKMSTRTTTVKPCRPTPSVGPIF